jgi:hypothetical protein
MLKRVELFLSSNVYFITFNQLTFKCFFSNFLQQTWPYVYNEKFKLYLFTKINQFVSLITKKELIIN